MTLKRRKVKVSYLTREGLLDNSDIPKTIPEMKGIISKFIDDILVELESTTNVDFEPELTMVSIAMENVGYSFDEYTPIVKMELYRWETDDEMQKRENSRRVAQDKRRALREEKMKKELEKEKVLYAKLKKKFEDT